ncbi:MAG: hypothetical protein WAT19_03480 [Ferruginibacter sp.]
MKQFIFGLITCMVLVQTVQAQGFQRILENPRLNENFISIAKRVNDYYAPLSVLQRKKEGYNLWKRHEYWAMKHLDASGNIGNDVKFKHEALELEQSRAASRAGDPQTNILNGDWAPVGPNAIQSPAANWLGRVNTLAFHPSISSIIYAGTPDGGLWVTYSGGNTWFPLTDGLPCSAISGIAINPTNPSIIYILTGDGDASPSVNYFTKRGAGVYKTTDAGNTWNITGLNWQLSEGKVGYELHICPTNANVLLAATSDGIYRTANAGQSWVRETSFAATSLCFKPNDVAKIAAVETNTSRIRLSYDTGKNWTSTPAFTLPDGFFYRGELAVTPANPELVYLVAWNFPSNYEGLHTFNWTTGALSVLHNSTNILGGQAWYNIGLWVSPSDVNQVSVAGTPVFRSTNGGTSFTPDQDILHPDIHGYYYNSLDGRLYITTDGGIAYSTNNGDTWTNITGNLQITEYYRISGVDSNPDILFGGSQDNGHHFRNTNTSTFQHKLTCCDGMDNAIEQSNPNIMYGFTQNGEPNVSTDGGASFTWIQPTIKAPLEPWITDFLIHPSIPATIFYGSVNGVLRHTSRGVPTNAWVNIGGRGTVDMAVSPANPNRFYGVTGDSLFRSDNINAATPAWILSKPVNFPIGSFITSLDVNPDNANEIWITASGYNAGVKVYRSINSGSSWTNESDNLPNIPVHVIKFQDTNGAPAGAVYIGTDVGVYYRDDTIGEWVFFSNGLPRTTVEDLEINETFAVITAGTFGRGMWRSLLYQPSCYNDISINTSMSGIQYQQAANSITLNADITGGPDTRVMLKAGNVITLNVGVDVLAGNELKAFLAPCANDNPVFRQQNNAADSLKTQKKQKQKGKKL